MRSHHSQDLWFKLPHSQQFLFCQYLESTNGLSQPTHCPLKPNWKPSFYQTKPTNGSFNSRSYKMTRRNIRLQLSERETLATYRILNLLRLIFYRHSGTTSNRAHGWRWRKKVNFSCTLGNKINTWCLALMVWLSLFTAAKNKNNTKLIACQASWFHGITMLGVLLRPWDQRPHIWLLSLKLKI